MDKKLVKYFWSHFKSLTIENQLLFVYQDNEWKSYKISHKETANSGQVNLSMIKKIGPFLKGKEVYIAHNHPSMPPNPSFPDYFQYRYIQSLLFLYDIKVCDFVIFSPYGYYSFKEAGELEEMYPYHGDFDKAFAVKTENLSLSSYIEKHKSSILSLSQQYRELIFNNRHQYGCKRDFEPSFILENENQLGYKNVFFRVRSHSKNELERLKSIDRILDPIEIYWIENDSLIPLKLSGIL